MVAHPNAEEFVQFLNQNGSPYHSVLSVVESILTPNGFKSVNNWGGHHADASHSLPHTGYFTEGDTTVFAFKKGAQFNPENGKIVMLVAHTDSPCLRTRVNSRQTSEECELLSVETYGGGLWSTWFDRGLGLAGKAVLRDGSTRLFRIAKPVAYIPSLCIHLQNAAERQALKINEEEHLRPVVAMMTGGTNESSAAHGASMSSPGDDSALENFSQTILKKVAESLKLNDNQNFKSEIAALDIRLFDTNPSQIGGCNDEFIEGQGLDNKTSVFCIFKALANAPVQDDTIYIAAAFDHEEVGSRSNYGANSTLATAWLDILLENERIFATAQKRAIYKRSVVVSCDAAHASHPNYASKYQADHKPKINKGVVIKSNGNQRYGTSVITRAFCESRVKELVPLQHFFVRNDTPCGSTIGPMLAALVGVETIDVGVPIWGMHSIREIGGVEDIGHLIKFGEIFLTQWSKYENVFL